MTGGDDVSFALLWTVAALAAGVIGFLRTSIGGGIGLVLMPTLSLLLPPSLVLTIVAPLMNLSDPIALRYYWRQWDGRQLRVLLPASLGGILVGGWVLARLSELWLARTIGVLALAFAFLHVVVARWPHAARPGPPPLAVGAAAGLLAGISSMVAHSGGIFLNLYLVNATSSTVAILATGNALVTFTNALKLIGYWRLGFLTWPILGAALLSAPLLAAGAWLGYRVHRRLPRRGLEWAIVTIAVASGLRLLLR